MYLLLILVWWWPPIRFSALLLSKVASSCQASQSSFPQQFSDRILRDKQANKQTNERKKPFELTWNKSTQFDLLVQNPDCLADVVFLAILSDGETPIEAEKQASVSHTVQSFALKMAQNK